MAAMKPQSQDWSTVLSFQWLPEALVVKTFFEGADIPCMIPEEHLGTIAPAYGPAMRFRVQVPEPRLAEAQELLAQQKMDAAAEADVCPKCGATLVEKPLYSKNWWRAFVGIFFGAPMRGKTQKVCPACERGQ